jgi:hypothetical protein
MRNNRKAAFFFTDNRIPVYEGDMVKVLISKEGKTSIRILGVVITRRLIKQG